MDLEKHLRRSTDLWQRRADILKIDVKDLLRAAKLQQDKAANGDVEAAAFLERLAKLDDMADEPITVQGS